MFGRRTFICAQLTVKSENPNASSRELAEISTRQSRVPVIFREEVHVDEVGLIPQNT